MLAAGGKRVFLIRGMEEHLEEALKEVLLKLDNQIALICESNSLRKHVVPGCFIMIKNRDGRYDKPSAWEVSHFADKVIEFDKFQKNIEINQLKFIEGKWYFKTEK